MADDDSQRGNVVIAKQWMFNGKAGSIRATKHTAQWDHQGIVWEQGEPHIAKTKQIPKLMRKGIYGFYVVGQGSIAKAGAPPAPKAPRAPGPPRAKRKRAPPRPAAAKGEKKQKDEEDGAVGDASRPECVVCLDAPPRLASPACGHLCMCDKCGALLKACPMCRAPFGGAKPLRIFQC